MSYLTIGNQIGNLLQFLFFIYFARQFGEGIVGQYSFAFSFTFLFSVFSDLGISTYMIREIAREKLLNRQIFISCLSLRLLSIGILIFFAVLIVYFFFGKFPKETIVLILLLGIYHILLGIADIFISEFKGHDRMGLVALLSILVRFIVSGLGIGLMMLGFDFLFVLTCFPIGALILLCVCVLYSFQYFKNIRLQYRNVRLLSLFIQMLPFTFTFIFVEVLYHQDILMLRFFENDQIVGIYSIAHKVVLVFLGVLLFVHTALLPHLSRLYVESRSILINISKQYLRYLLLLGMPLSTGLYAISNKAVILIFTDTFKDSVAALNILSWTIAINFAAAIYAVLLTAINRQTQKGIGLGICMLFNLILNLILIPQMSFYGAAIAKLMTEALHLILFYYFVSKYLSSLSIQKLLFKPAISCLIMYVIIQMVFQLNLIFIILISIFVYSICLLILGGYTSKEIDFLKHLLLRTKAIQEN